MRGGFKAMPAAPLTWGSFCHVTTSIRHALPALLQHHSILAPQFDTLGRLHPPTALQYLPSCLLASTHSVSASLGQCTLLAQV